MNKVNIISWRNRFMAGALIGLAFFFIAGRVSEVIGFFSAMLSGLIAAIIAAWAYGKWGTKYIKPSNDHNVALGAAAAHAVFSVIFSVLIFLLVAAGITALTELQVGAGFVLAAGSIALGAIMVGVLINAVLIYIAFRISFKLLGGRKQ